MAASRFMGPGQQRSAGFSLIYRGFNHAKMKKVCSELQKPTLKSTIQDILGRQTVSRPVQEFAKAFLPLQEARHLADYDPRVRFLESEVVGLINAAKTAIDDFNSVPDPEQADILALLLLDART